MKNEQSVFLDNAGWNARLRGTCGARPAAHYFATLSEYRGGHCRCANTRWATRSLGNEWSVRILLHEAAPEKPDDPSENSVAGKLYCTGGTISQPVK